MNYIEAINAAKTSEALSDVFNKLSAEPATTQRLEIDAIEKELMPEFLDNISFVQTESELKLMVQGYQRGLLNSDDHALIQDILIDAPKMMEKIVFEISRVKKDESHPLVKEFLSHSMLIEKKDMDKPETWYATFKKMKLPSI